MSGESGDGSRRARRERAGARSAQPRHEPRRASAILAVALAVAGVVAAGVALDREGAAPDDVATAPTLPDPADAGGDDPAALAPLAPGAGATGSTWFCAGGTATAEGEGADHVVVIANPGDAGLTAAVTVYAGAAEDDAAGRAAAAATAPVTEQVDVPSRSRAEVRLGDLVTAPYASALVEVEGGDVVVEHRVEGDGEFGVGPCASQPATSWYFATGTTTLGSSETLVLFNPFIDDAVLDIAFTTPEGERERVGMVVPGRQVLAIPTVERVSEVATSIVARAGRLVVDRIQSFDGSAGPAGLDVTLAAPSPAPLWYFPEGRTVDGVSEVVTVYNPTDQPAEVDVELVLAPSPDPTVVTAVEPFQLSLAPRAYAEVAVDEDARVPRDLAHSIVVRSQNGVPVVAERWQRGELEPTEVGGDGSTTTTTASTATTTGDSSTTTTAAAGDPTATTPTTAAAAAGDPAADPTATTATSDPTTGDTTGDSTADSTADTTGSGTAGPGAAPVAGRSGLAATMGSPVVATRWLLAAGSTGEGESEVLVLLNPSPTALARFTVTIPSPTQDLVPAGLQDAEVPAGGRVEIDLGTLVNRPDLPLVITSTEPVVVERVLTRVGAGFSQSVAVADATAAAVPSVDTSPALPG